jgi:hypothetical protein
MTRFILALFLAIGFAGNQALANKKKKPYHINIPTMTDSLPEVANEEYYQKNYGKLENSGSRKISQSVSDVPAIEKTYSQDFITLRDELIGNSDRKDAAGKSLKGIESPEDLDKLILKYSKPDTYDKLSPEAKMVVVQLRAVWPFKSFFHRAKTYFGNGTAIRSAIVTMLRNSSTAINVFFPVSGEAPVNHWNVVFRYMTEPMEGMGEDIKTDEQLHQFVVDYTNYTRGELDRMYSIYKSTDSIWWDNKLFMSFANFTSEKDRYIKLGKPEFEAILAGAYGSWSGLATTAAYSFEGLSDSIRDMGSFFGIEEARNVFRNSRNDRVSGMKAQHRFAVLRKYPKLFTLLPEGKNLTAPAYTYMLASVNMAEASWNRLRGSNENRTDFLFDPRVVQPFNTNRLINTSFKELRVLLSSSEAKSTLMQGEMVQLNLRLLYLDPPQSLRDFYPVAFNSSPDEYKKDVAGKSIPYRNYLAGSPTTWSHTAYVKYFPSIKQAPCPRNLVEATTACTSDVGVYSRILSQTWGTAGFGAALAGMVF